MVKRCVVAGCSNSYKTGHSLHVFPKDDRIRQLWTRFIKLTRVDFISPTQHSVICSAHFTDNCYEVERLQLKEMFGMSSIKRLLPNSVPSIHFVYPKRHSYPDSLNEGVLSIPKKKMRISSVVKKRETSMFSPSTVRQLGSAEMPVRKKPRIGRRKKNYGRKKVRHYESLINQPVEELTLNTCSEQISVLIELPGEDQDSYFWEIPGLHDISVTFGEKMTEQTDSDGIFGDEFYVVLDHIYKYEPSVNLEDFVKDKIAEKYLLLKKECELFLDQYENFEIVKKSKYIRYVQLYDSLRPTVKISITVNENFLVEIVVHRTKLPKDHSFWETYYTTNKFTDVSKLKSLLHYLSEYKICIGNPETYFLLDLPYEGFYKHYPTPDCAGYLENDVGAFFDDFYYNSTIRSSQCPLLSKTERCKNCQIYRRTLAKRRLRQNAKLPSSKKNWLTSNKANIAMTEQEKLTKMHQMKKYIRELEQTNKMLEKKVRKSAQPTEHDHQYLGMTFENVIETSG